MATRQRQNMTPRDLWRIQARDRVPGAKGSRWRGGHCTCSYCVGRLHPERAPRERKAMKYETQANND